MRVTTFTTRKQLLGSGNTSMALPLVYVTKKMHFSAAHRLYSTQLSEEENQRIYGKCANPNGHGHNYIVQVTMKGPVDPVTGMVMNITDLKEAMEVGIMKQMDHKHLDKDVPFFKDHVSTSENLAIFIWQQLLQSLGDKGHLLYEVLIEETPNNTFVYRGEQQ